LSKLIKIEKYATNSLIVQEGTIANRFFLLSIGRVRVFRTNNTIRGLEKENYFCELSLLNKENIRL